MPRLSAEARAAAGFRSGGHRPPPKHLSAAAKAHWRAIVADKPLDWFDAGNRGLLSLYCTLLAYCDRLDPLVAEGDVAAVKEYRKTSATLTTLATKLRFSVQSCVRRDSGKLSERGTGLSPHLGGDVLRLIGGRAVQEAGE